MHLAIEVYMIVCVLLLIFDLVFLTTKNLRNHRLFPKNEKLKEQIQEEIGKHRETGAFSQDFEEELTNKLRKTKNLLALMGELEQDPEAAGWFRGVIFALLADYRKKTDYEQAYYTYVISTFDYQKEKVPEAFAGEFLAFLDSKSLYTFSNTMDALYRFGETHLLVNSIDKVDQRKGFYHKKLLVDGLLDSQADFAELNRKLVERFDRYTPYMKDCLLDFLRMNGYDIAELCMRLLTADDTDFQVRYTAMRYFAKCPTAGSKAYFLDVLADGQRTWLEQMLAIQGLMGYDDTQVRAAIQEKVTDRNWYVRVNAVQYLYKQGLTRQEVFDILYLRDRYANNTLLYQYHGDKEMTRYIIDTIQLLTQQDEETATGQANLEALPV